MSRYSKSEWIRLMTELAAVDRDEYRRLRAEAWARIALKHGRLSEQQIAEWVNKSS